jgi:hypothetical protein
MVARQYFDHLAQDGRDMVARLRATGYVPSNDVWLVGENLAWGTGTLATPRNIVIAWMNSPGHRANILRPQFREIGFGVVPGNPSRPDGAGATYTTNFGAIGDGSSATTQIASTSAPTSRSTRVRHRTHRKHARHAKASRAHRHHRRHHRAHHRAHRVRAATRA